MGLTAFCLCGWSVQVSKAVMDEARRKTSARRTHTASSGTRPPGLLKPAAATKPSSDGPPTASKRPSLPPSAPPSERKGSSSRGPTSMTIGQRLSSACVPTLGPAGDAAPPAPASCPPPRTPPHGPPMSEVGSPDVRHLQNGVDVDLNIKPTSIFPTFRVVANESGYKAIRDSAQHNRTLAIAYNRLEERISKEKVCGNQAD